MHLKIINPEYRLSTITNITKEDLGLFKKYNKYEHIGLLVEDIILILNKIEFDKDFLQTIILCLINIALPGASLNKIKQILMNANHQIY